MTTHDLNLCERLLAELVERERQRQEDIRREWRILRAYHEWMMWRE